ncbi:MAG: VCBS repeat-containing protein [Bacteroidales bacterium]|nr:VCBS repeat-containing protein [Bacteroidales bacterium]
MKILTFLSLFALAISPLKSQEQSQARWRHFSIDPVLPGSSWGTGGPALADYDGDGDLDVAISRRNTLSAYWYERINDSLWIQHLVGSGETFANTLGSTPIDIDHDGWMDVMFNGIWFRNPGILADYPDVPWKGSLIKAGGHDAATVDINGNGEMDILVYDGNKLAWYNTSNTLREHIISSGHHDHGGTAPCGHGDLDGDGDPDVIIPGFWYENPGDGTGSWEEHLWPFVPVPHASYGRSTRSWITDVDGDGINDIVYSHCDTGGSHVYWVKNGGEEKSWTSFQLPDPPARSGDTEGTGSFHSLGVADFNLDGFPDIFAGEQEDPDVYMESDGLVAMKPRGLKERGVIWYSNGARLPQFTPYIIHLDNPGWHDAQLGDVDGDGDIDIVSKVWNADGPSYHLDLWRNEVIK